MGLADPELGREFHGLAKNVVGEIGVKSSAWVT